MNASVTQVMYVGLATDALAASFTTGRSAGTSIDAMRRAPPSRGSVVVHAHRMRAVCRWRTPTASAGARTKRLGGGCDLARTSHQHHLMCTVAACYGGSHQGPLM